MINLFETVASVVGGVIDTCAGDKIKDKMTEIIDNRFTDPALILEIEQSLLDKFGELLCYNDITKYIKSKNTISYLVNMFYGNEGEIRDIDNFVAETTESFTNEFPTHITERKKVEEIFSYIYTEVYGQKLRINPHSDLGKLRTEMLRIGNKVIDKIDALAESQSTVSSYTEQIHAQLGGLTTVATEDIGTPSEKIKEFLKLVEGIGGKENPVSSEEDAIDKYKSLLAEIPTQLRGENQHQIDTVVCCIKCHIALAYSNLGDATEALKQLDVIQDDVAKESKLYHFVKAAIIVNLSIEEKYDEASVSIDTALRLCEKYHMAFFVKQYLLALQKKASFEDIVKALDLYYKSILETEKTDNLIATYFLYRALIHKEFTKYNEAIENYVAAKKYGYDEIILDYNIATSYYLLAVKEIPKDTRVYKSNVEIAEISKVIEILQKWLFGDKKAAISNLLKSRMVGIYVSSCGLIGISHGLKPVSDYINLPGLDYEVIRIIILGSDDNISDDEIALLKGDDKTFAQISNFIRENDYESVKTLFFSMTQPELSVLNAGLIYMLLQACIISKDINSYWKYRPYAETSTNPELLECLDAYAHEENGDITKAKPIIDKHALESKDYHILSNIINFYSRNKLNAELENLLLHILQLKQKREIHIEELPAFYERAISFLTEIKSKNAQEFIKALNEENLTDISVLNVEANYYVAIGDTNRLYECITKIYDITHEYKDGYTKIICLIRLMKYSEALELALSLYNELSNDKEKSQMSMLISDIYLYLEDNDNSFEWAKKAHELSIQNPHDISHQFYMGRATRTNHTEAISDTLEYKETHPVVLGGWLKEFKISSENPVEDLKKALEEVSGQSHDDYEERKAKIAELYRSNHIPNSMLLKHCNQNLSQLFFFAEKNKLSIANGNIETLNAEKTVISDDIFVDALTLIIMQKYQCFKALEHIPRVHICFSTISYLQSFVSGFDAYYVLDILKWLKSSKNVVLEPDGYKFESETSDFLSKEVLACCVASIENNIPLLTVESIIKLLQKHKIEVLPLNVITVSIPAFCSTVLKEHSHESEQMLYNLLRDCRFISFSAKTILLQIEKSEYKIDENYLDRFLICDTTCDMISFASVYLGVVSSLLEEHREAAIEFTKLVLNDSKKIWNRSTYIRYILETNPNDIECQHKLKSIQKYLIYLVYGIKQLYLDIPSEVKNEYEGIIKIISRNISIEIINELKTSLGIKKEA